MPSRTVITNCINASTKLASIFEIDSVGQIDLSNENMPFFSMASKGRVGIKVVFRPGKLPLEPIPGAEPDPYVRQFIVLLDNAATKVLMVRSKIKGKSKDIHPEAPARDAETELRSLGEVYEGFPDLAPKITFLDAVDVVRKRGAGYPPLAKEIEGTYVMYSRYREAAHPVWVITLRGLPPLEAQHNEDVPIWERNHMRNIVDAMTGNWIFANNCPSPLATP